MDKYNELKEEKLSLWGPLKYRLHATDRLPFFKEGEVWWCSCGENIGIEINGKNTLFSRPVLIYHKYNKCSFLGIPLTSQEHRGSWYVPFKVHGKVNYAVLCQIRVYDVRRLSSKLCELDENDMKDIVEGFNSLYNKD